MSKGTIIGMLLLLMMSGTVAFVACDSRAAQDSKPTMATWIKPEIAGDAVSIPVSEIERNRMSHFSVSTSAGDVSFMAYVMDREIYVRADICPPCQSKSFSLDKATLVCDSCATVFDAKTGDGIKGACVAYPKASVPYEISSGKVILKAAGLMTAYLDTLKPGRP